jgi:hypothetical protein
MPPSFQGGGIFFSENGVGDLEGMMRFRMRWFAA